MKRRISVCGHLTGAITAVAFTVTTPVAIAQPAQLVQPTAQIAAGMDEAVKALDSVPRLKKLSPEAKRRLVEFVAGNTLFVVAHELGHGVVHELDLPVLGREEDAADSFAIVTALNLGPWFTDRVLMEATKGWFLFAKQRKKAGHAPTFYGAHSIDLQRAYNIVCFMVGSDRKRYGALAAETALPQHRQDSCVYEWKNTSGSWEKVLNEHLRAPDQPKVDIKVEYEETEAFAIYARILRHMRLLEAFAEHFGDRYAWPRPLTFEVKSCGMANARWRQRVLTFCYELADLFLDLYRDYSSLLPARERDLR